MKKNDIVMWEVKSEKIFGRIFFSEKLSKLAIDVGYTWLPIIPKRQYFIVQ